jgi:hypothetical protein
VETGKKSSRLATFFAEAHMTRSLFDSFSNNVIGPWKRSNNWWLRTRYQKGKSVERERLRSGALEFDLPPTK